MKDAVVAILASSSTALPPNSTPSPHHHHHPFSTSTKPKSIPKHKPKPKTSYSSTKPTLLSTIHWSSISDNRNGGIRYYAEMASKLAEDGRLEDFLMIAESVVASSSGAKSSQFAALLNAKLVSTGISRRLKQGEVRSVVELLSGLKKLRIGITGLFDGLAIEALRQACCRIVQNGDVEQIVTLMEILQGFNFSTKDLVEPSEIIRLCVTKRNTGAAIRFARIYPQSQLLCCTIILEFGKKGDLSAALTVFEASKQIPGSPNMYAYRTVIDVCGLCGDYMKSRLIYEELLTSKIMPNVYVFNSIMNVNACDLRYTLQVYKQMKRLGLRADLPSYNILLKSCCLAARVDLARDIYRELQRLETTGALKLDVFTYSTLIKVFADAKMWQMALKIKEDMLSAGVTPNTVTWTSLISACANAGLVEQAIQLFEEMLLAGCKANWQCCNILLHACVEACQYDRAFRLFQSWKENGSHEIGGQNDVDDSDSTDIKRLGGNSTANLLCRTSTSQSLNLPMRVPFKPTTSTYNTLMKACGTDYYRAKALMDEMKTIGLSPNHISRSILIDICGGSGNVEGALQILRSMREAGIQPDVIAYTTAIKVCVESKNLKVAFSLFTEMKRYQVKPNMVTYNTLLRARSKYGSLKEVQQCLAIYQDMRKAGYKANDYYLKRLIEEWCEEVIQISNKHKGHSIRNTNDLPTQSQLLEKVAEHLRKNDPDSISIDLQGLSKVEARIVVLAVLRMIKESYTPGDVIKDDMLIILGVQDESADAKGSGVDTAIIRLLQNDMELEVLTGRSSTIHDLTSDSESFDNSDTDFDVLERSRLLTEFESSARRPAVVKRIKVSKESLNQWLQKREGGSA